MKKTVLITGASGSLGRALARSFGQAGMNLALHYSTGADRIHKLKRELETLGFTCRLFRANLQDPKAPALLIKDARKAFGRLDILINNAGAHPGQTDFLNINLKEWENIFRVNTTAPFFLAREAFKLMPPGGRIINISSITVKFGGSARSLHYAASKAALETWTQGMARLGAPKKILVNAIRAGVIEGPVHRSSGQDLSKRISFIPLKRMGKPDEIAQLALFLASEGGEYITGQVLPVTGGE